MDESTLKSGLILWNIEKLDFLYSCCSQSNDNDNVKIFYNLKQLQTEV